MSSTVQLSSYLQYFPTILCLQCNEIAADENDDIKADIDDCQNAEDYDHDYDEDADKEEVEDSLFTKISKKIRAFFNPVRSTLAVLLLCGVAKAMVGRYFISVAKLGLGGVRIGEKVIQKVRGQKKVLTYDAAMNLVDTTKYVNMIMCGKILRFHSHFFIASLTSDLYSFPAIQR
jgi:hypothetical protein